MKIHCLKETKIIQKGVGQQRLTRRILDSQGLIGSYHSPVKQKTPRSPTHVWPELLMTKLEFYKRKSEDLHKCDNGVLQKWENSKI